ncbi:MAG TPA: PhnD/SsuA/transferrin family substrate-binding protein [Gemmataceae bacterium]|nr:PhnD/SsuA/transferrin family substrate-binding protein [Gemmataceae bacterium]
MTPRRLAVWCLSPALLLVVPGPAPAQTKTDRPVLKVRIYNSIMQGFNKSDARASTQPMASLIGRNVGVKVDLDIADGTTADDLFAFGKKVQDGEYHLGAVWGAEYGWFREKYPALAPLVVVTASNTDIPNRTMVLVHKDSKFKALADLKGKRLAVSKDMPFMDRLSLPVMLRQAKLDPKDFFVRREPYGTVRLAAAAVKNGNAECVVMATSIYFRLRELQPGLARELVELKAGDDYPNVVLVGSPALVERLRKDLWRDLRTQFLEMHNTAEGKECLNFWRVGGFTAPDAAFDRGVEATVKRLPISVLLNPD